MTELDKQMLEKVKEISALRMARNFTGAIVDYAKDGFRNVTAVQHASRMVICNGCEFWDKQAFMGLGKCKKCGCSGAKLWIAGSKCPIGKW